MKKVIKDTNKTRPPENQEPIEESKDKESNELSSSISSVKPKANLPEVTLYEKARFEARAIARRTKTKPSADTDNDLSPTKVFTEPQKIKPTQRRYSTFPAKPETPERSFTKAPTAPTPGAKTTKR